MKIVSVSGLVLLVILGTFRSLSAQGISLADAAPRIRELISEDYAHLREGFLQAIQKSVEGDRPSQDLIVQDLERAGFEVKAEYYEGLTSHSLSLEFKDSFYIYLDVDTSGRFPVYGALLSKYGPSIGSCSFSYYKDLRLRGGTCEVYEGFDRQRVDFFDDQLHVKKSDFYFDPDVLSYRDIYDSDDVVAAKGVRVAVIDSGVDYNHPALARNIPRSINNEGIWEILGWDFEDHDSKPFDLAENDAPSHGTGVAYMAIQANPNVQIVPLRTDFEMGTIAAIDYVRAHRIPIVNMSFEVDPKTPDEERIPLTEKLKTMMMNAEDTVFVVAAGNETLNLDHHSIAPQTFALPNMVVVGSVDRSGRLTKNDEWGSNFSKTHVHIAALGNDVRVPIPNGFDVTAGTSFAAPQVAGLLSKYKGEAPDASPLQLFTRLFADLKVLSPLRDVTVYGGIPRELTSFLNLGFERALSEPPQDLP